MSVFCHVIVPFWLICGTGELNFVAFCAQLPKNTAKTETIKTKTQNLNLTSITIPRKNAVDRFRVSGCLLSFSQKFVFLLLPPALQNDFARAIGRWLKNNLRIKVYTNLDRSVNPFDQTFPVFFIFYRFARVAPTILAVFIKTEQKNTII